MVEKSKSKGKKLNIRMIIVSLVLLVAVIIVSILLKNYGRETLNDSYFVSDANKIVMTLDGADAAPIEDDTTYIPIKVHTVYYYVGDSITGAKVFYEYDNTDVAKAVYEKTSIENKDWATGKSLDGKYVIFQYDSNLVKAFTPEQIRESVENVESVL